MTWFLPEISSKGLMANLLISNSASSGTDLSQRLADGSCAVLRNAVRFGIASDVVMRQ